MKILVHTTMMIFLICIILVIILNIVSKKMIPDREKHSPFECGFDPKNFARLPFSLSFFLVALIFIIFDVELTLLLPSIYLIKMTNIKSFSFTLIMFIIILLAGFYHELNQGALNWMK